MTNTDILHHRLVNQQIAATRFRTPQEIVQWMVAMQAQDYAMAKWAIGLRLPGSTDETIENALSKGSILRTHLLRPTWHFVTPADIRWLIELSASRVNAAQAYMNRKLGLTSKIFKRSNDILEKALAGKNLTRIALQSILQKAKIKTDENRLSHLLFAAELNGIICSGPREGKQFTYALLEERVPPVRKITRDEALAELARRYFASRGPATIKDYAWWSGLSLTDARKSVSTVPPDFEKIIVKGTEYLFVPKAVDKKMKVQDTFLLPSYDEYGISYQDRAILFQPKNIPDKKWFGSPVFDNMFIVNGTIGGTWKKNMENKRLVIETTSYNKLNKATQKKLAEAVKKYILFIQAKIK